MHSTFHALDESHVICVHYFSIYENFELVLNSFKFDFALKPNVEHVLC